MKREEGGECTYIVARGESVIDYVITDEEGREGIERMRVRERIDSDHFPLIVSISGKEELESKGEGKEKKRWGGDWATKCGCGEI